MATFPTPELPFNGNVGCVSVFGSDLAVDVSSGEVHDISRKLWVEIELILSSRTNQAVGGILFSGLPYVPYQVTARGEVTSNFGLPREIRVSWSNSDEAGFLDAESSLTEQSVTSHSGPHILATGPVRTDRLRLRLSDFPRFFRELDLAADSPRLVEFWGFVIPLLHVFGHTEKTRYRPSVPGGLVATAVAAPDAPTPGASVGDMVGGSTGSTYWMTSAASLFRPARTLPSGSAALPDIFVSRRVPPGQQLRIYFEQTEEYERCLAGLRLNFGSFPDVDGSMADPPLRASVYELDPPEGESPCLSSSKGSTRTGWSRPISTPLRRAPIRSCRCASCGHPRRGSSPSS